MLKKLLALLICTLFITGCSYDPVITEADVITLRPYTVKSESGMFAVKTKTSDYIEYTFEHDGEIKLETIHVPNIEIGDETKVIIENDGDWIFYDLQLSLEKYKELYGLEEENE